MNMILAIPDFAKDPKNSWTLLAICNRAVLIVLFKVNTTKIIYY